MRQVSGSAVQGLEGAALRPARLPGPRGFSLLNQLILDPGETASRTQEQQEKEFSWGENLRGEAKQTGRRRIGDREGNDAEWGRRRTGGRGVGGELKRKMEGRKVSCKRVVTASQLV